MGGNSIRRHGSFAEGSEEGRGCGNLLLPARFRTLTTCVARRMYNTATHPLSTEEVPTMPVYEYVCSGCKKMFEVIKPITEYGKKAVICPMCRKTMSIVLAELHG